MCAWTINGSYIDNVNTASGNEVSVDLNAGANAFNAHELSTTSHGTTGANVGTTNIQTLTNKTLTSPDINTPDIDGGTIDGTVIGGTTPAVGNFTYIYGPPQIYSKTFILPEYIQDEIDFIPMLYVDATWAPQGIRISKVGMALDANRAYAIMLEKWTSANPPAHSEDILTGDLDPGGAASLATTVNTFTTTTTYYDVVTGNIVGVDLPTTVDALTLTVWFVYSLLGT